VRSRTALLCGVALLIIAQLLASQPLKRMRQGMIRSSDAGFTAVTPGEFAGTLLLGGFRGLACDMLWLRADTAQEEGKFYESQALFGTISHIQPGFTQVWSYMSWNMAYNIGHEVEDQDAKWSWMLSGVEINVTGCERNPQSEFLLNHLAWMLNHHGDLFHAEIEAHDWQPLLGPLITAVNAQLPAAERLPPFPSGAGMTNYRIAAILYAACLKLRDAQGMDPSTYAARMLPLAIECDGDLYRNRGEHLRALKIWIEALQSWQTTRQRYLTPFTDVGEEMRRELGLESYARNEGTLRRKASELARQLAPDPQTGSALAQAILQRDISGAQALLARPGFATSARFGRIQWLDER